MNGEVKGVKAAMTTSTFMERDTPHSVQLYTGRPCRSEVLLFIFFFFFFENPRELPIRDVQTYGEK